MLEKGQRKMDPRTRGLHFPKSDSSMMDFLRFHVDLRVPRPVAFLGVRGGLGIHVGANGTSHPLAPGGLEGRWWNEELPEKEKQKGNAHHQVRGS